MTCVEVGDRGGLFDRVREEDDFIDGRCEAKKLTLDECVMKVDAHASRLKTRETSISIPVKQCYQEARDLIPLCRKCT